MKQMCMLIQVFFKTKQILIGMISTIKIQQKVTQMCKQYYKDTKQTTMYFL